MAAAEPTPCYYKKRYAISFYRDVPLSEGGEQFVACFDNVAQICKARGDAPTPESLSLVKIELCRALKRMPPTTRMLDGTAMKVYLIDMLVDDMREEELERERREKCMAKKRFVRISSSMNIEVYANLEAIEILAPAGSNKGDLLNAKSGWAKIRVLITANTAWYPSEILEWEAVKMLAAKEIINVGEQADTISNPEMLKRAEEAEKAIGKGKRDVTREKERVATAAKAATGGDAGSK